MNIFLLILLTRKANKSLHSWNRKISEYDGKRQLRLTMIGSCLNLHYWKNKHFRSDFRSGSWSISCQGSFKNVSNIFKQQEKEVSDMSLIEYQSQGNITQYIFILELDREIDKSLCETTKLYRKSSKKISHITFVWKIPPTR